MQYQGRHISTAGFKNQSLCVKEMKYNPLRILLFLHLLVKILCTQAVHHLSVVPKDLIPPVLFLEIHCN